MTKITDREYYVAARERLTSVTSDAALLAAFERQAEYDLAGDSESEDQGRLDRWNQAMGDFLAEIMRVRLSLDYVFGGKGEPFMPPLPDPTECAFAPHWYRLPDELKPVFAEFVSALADYTHRQTIKKHKPKDGEPDGAAENLDGEDMS